MYTKINNVLLVVFVVLGFLELIITSKRPSPKAILLIGWPILIFFGLATLASFRTIELQSFKFLENHWSLLFIPIVMLSEPKGFSKNRRNIFLALLLGSLSTLLICYGHLIWQITTEQRAFNYLVSTVGHNFTAIADTHPTYLGLFVITAMFFLIQDRTFPVTAKYVILVFFSIGLVQLASEMALLIFCLVFSYMVVHNMMRQRNQLIILILGIALCIFVFWSFGGKYMSSQMFTVDSILDEKRIERWEVSYQIFKEHPFFGVGFEKIEHARQIKYQEGEFSLAAQNDLNAHNQFLEYLSVNGAIGGFVYAIAFAFLFFLSVNRRDHLFTFLFFSFILANLTESMMVRIKGIEYYAIFASLFLCSFETFNDVFLNEKAREKSGKQNNISRMVIVKNDVLKNG
ncbi:MAG: O-antigen ligase family protein [Bacteroidota bacterium]